MVQTHISCVFLTGDYAYKVKKPVDFGFLDYRTLEQRRAFCEQEIRLNGRLCPDLYLDPVPITRNDSGLHVGGKGVPVEWAVRMRQLRSEEMLCSRSERGDVCEADIRRVASVLADFHSRSATNPEIQAWGMHAVISRTIRNTLDSMDTLAGPLLSPHGRAVIRRSLKSFLDEERGLLCRRADEGCIRDCHGDLRTQNICFDPRYDGGIQIFDCIEFNHEFRYIDVAADLAYLAMDLDLAGRADLRGNLVDMYSHVRNDGSLQRALHFYMIYRACVRGNIALFAANEREVPEPEREAQRETAAAAYDLARCYARLGAGPALLITVGFSGSGKSSLARELSRRLPAILISTDGVRKECAGVEPTARLAAAAYGPSQRAEVYAEVYRKASGYISRGEHVLLDGTFLSRQERETAARLARRVGAEFWMLECRCPEEVIRRRLTWRHGQSTASDADVTVYERQTASNIPVTLPVGNDVGNPHHIIVDTEQPSQHGAHEVVDRFTDSGGSTE